MDFLLSSKKTRFDTNSIDLLLSMDRIERGAVVTSSLLCDFRSAWLGAKLERRGVQKRSCEMVKMEAALKAIRDGATMVYLYGARV